MKNTCPNFQPTAEYKEKVIREIAEFDDSTISDEEWNTKLLDTADSLRMSVEELLSEIEIYNECRCLETV